ncbi:MAG TPA: SDR family oxidoreductase [Planctomycetota bacterium]|nr:SDR family oxidoreductase [Planctomycetota bacterium]
MLLALVLAIVCPSLPYASAQARTAETAARSAPPRAVLVTGASSGIGRRTTELLAAEGFYVYATARSDADLAELDALENVQAVRIDVTKPDEIEAAVRTVTDAGRGLYALINNAGVVVLGPLIELREEDLAFQLDVNVMGPYRVTRAFAPLLIESKGRVLTTGSISGTVTWPMGGAYTISKHAVEAFSDTLAAELAPFGVAVSLVSPGNYRSEIMTNMRQRMLDAGYSGEGSRYAEHMDRLLGGPADRAQYKQPDEVAETFLRALQDETPRRRYMVVPDRREADLTLRAAVTRVVELNAEQPYALDRKALIRLLDEALAGN